MRWRLPVATLAIGVPTASVALGDWNTGDPYRWVQYPDLSTMRIDINATASMTGSPRYILADDLLCTVASQMTDIRVRGS